MANTIDFILTNAASELISKVLGGKTLNFTRMAVGDGFSYDTTVAKGYKTLVNEVLNIDITKSETLSASSVKVTSVFKNTDAQKEFYYREVGLYAQDPDTGEEILYAYGNRNDAAELITPSGSSVITKQLAFIISVGNSANVTFKVNAGVYALQEDLTTVQISLHELNSTKASQNDLAVERARITNLATLKEGSTTGDAELIDARVGADGQTYTSIGEASRNQLNILNDNLTQLEKIAGVPVSNLIKSWTNTVITDTGVETENTGVHTCNYCQLNKSGKATITWKVVTGDVYLRIVYYNNSMTFIKRVTIDNIATNGSYEVSASVGDYIRVSLENSKTAYVTEIAIKENYEKQYKDVDTEINSINDELLVCNNRIQTLENTVYYKKPTVNLFDVNNPIEVNLYPSSSMYASSSSTYSIYVPIDIKKGNLVTVKKANSSRFYIATSNNKPVVNGQVNQAINKSGFFEHTITITENDKYLLVFYFNEANDTKLNREDVRNSIKIFYGKEWTDGVTNQDRYSVYPCDDVLKDRELIWYDEFSQSKLDEDKWEDIEASDKRGICRADGNISFVNSNKLCCRISKEPDGQWTGALLRGKVSFQEGLIETKMKFAGIGGHGGLWLMGSNNNEYINDKIGVLWPLCGEIDMAECTNPTNYTVNIHYSANGGTGSSNDTSVRITQVFDQDLSSSYHIYGCELTSDKILFYIDRMLVASVNKADYKTNDTFNAFTLPMMPRLSLMPILSGNEKIPDDVLTREMYTEWVRIYAPINNANVEPTKILIDGYNFGETLHFKIGDTHDFVTTITPDNVTNLFTIWNSSDESIAEVSKYGGRLTCKKSGTVTITATMWNKQKAFVTVVIS